MMGDTGKPQPPKSDQVNDGQGIMEVLKRKVCAADEDFSSKKTKTNDTNDVDLEFVEISAEENDWMVSAALPKPDHSSNNESFLHLISAMAAKSAITGETTQAPVDSKTAKNTVSADALKSAISAEAATSAAEMNQATFSDPVSQHQWQLNLKSFPFNSVHEDSLFSWSGDSNMILGETSSNPDVNTTGKWMLNSSRKVCGFVHCDTVVGKLKATYYCNFCKLTDSSYGSFYQHLNHHLFVCGVCAYNSSTRLDVEAHRQRHGHVTSLSEGYMIHKTRPGQLSQLNSHSDPSVSGSSLVDWQTIQLDTESLIILESVQLPKSAQKILTENNIIADNKMCVDNICANMVCALPYKRYISHKSYRKNVLEYHCNYCQSTPSYTQELYRHIDFHNITCKEQDCTFQCFTNLELFVHQKNVHLEKYKDFFDNLVIFMPDSPIPEEDFVSLGGTDRKWQIILGLPREVRAVKSESDKHVIDKEREWRCKVCNNFVINKGGLSTHLILLHKINPKLVDLYMEPIL